MLALTLLSCLGLISAVIFISFPWLDIAAARLFYLGDGQFVGTLQPFVRLMKEAISNAALLCAAFTIVGLLVSEVRQCRFFYLSARHLRFLLYALLIGPGLLVNGLFKSYWGRARPNDTAIFGGDYTFSPALMVTDQCQSNCSFVSGDVSFAFFLLAFAFLLPFRRSVTTRSVVAFGAFIGLVRMSDGSHFLSDVIFAGIFTSMVVYGARLLVLEGLWGLDEAFHAKLRALARMIWSAGRQVPVRASLGLAVILRRATNVRGRDGLAADGQKPWPARVRHGLWLFFLSRPDDMAAGRTAGTKQ